MLTMVVIVNYTSFEGVREVVFVIFV